MGTLGNVPLASAHGRRTAAALSCIQWKAHHKFHVPHDIEYLQNYNSEWVNNLFFSFFEHVSKINDRCDFELNAIF